MREPPVPDLSNYEVLQYLVEHQPASRLAELFMQWTGQQDMIPLVRRVRALLVQEIITVQGAQAIREFLERLADER